MRLALRFMRTTEGAQEAVRRFSRADLRDLILEASGRIGQTKY